MFAQKTRKVTKKLLDYPSKCGSKSIDLDKKHTLFAQMYVKNHRFGQKTIKRFAQIKVLLYLCSRICQVFYVINLTFRKSI